MTRSLWQTVIYASGYRPASEFFDKLVASLEELDWFSSLESPEGKDWKDEHEDTETDEPTVY